MISLILLLSFCIALTLATPTQSQTLRENDSTPALISINEKNYTLPSPGPNFIKTINIDDAEVQRASLLDAPTTMLAYLWSKQGFLSPSISVARPLPENHPGLSTRLIYTDFPPGRYAAFFEFESGKTQIYYMTRKYRARREFLDGPQTVLRAAVLNDPEDFVDCDLLDGNGNRTVNLFHPDHPNLAPATNITGFACSGNMYLEYPLDVPGLPFHM